MLGERIGRVRKIGGSCMVILPVAFLRACGLERGDEVVFNLVASEAILMRKIPREQVDAIIQN